jgi:hypothetical protein
MCRYKLYVLTYICICIHVYIYKYIFIYSCFSYINIHIQDRWKKLFIHNLYVYTHISTYCLWSHFSRYIYMYICIYTYIYIHICINIYIHQYLLLVKSFSIMTLSYSIQTYIHYLYLSTYERQYPIIYTYTYIITNFWWIHFNIYKYIYIYTYIHIYIYTYIYIMHLLFVKSFSAMTISYSAISSSDSSSVSGKARYLSSHLCRIRI